MKLVKKISIDESQPNIELDKIKERRQILLNLLTILTKFPVNRNTLKSFPFGNQGKHGAWDCGRWV